MNNKLELANVTLLEARKFNKRNSYMKQQLSSKPLSSVNSVGSNNASVMGSYNSTTRLNNLTMISTASNLIAEGYSSNEISDKSLLLRDDVKNHLNDIDVSVLNLKNLFKRNDPFEERRLAATKCDLISYS